VKQVSATSVAQATPPAPDKPAPAAEKPAPTPPPVATTKVQLPVLPALPLPGNDGPATQPVAAAPAKPVVKPQAEKLLVEARTMQKEGRLIEARQKAIEAQRLGATFGPDEERPELVLLAISSLCEKRIESLMQQATELTVQANGDPAKTQKAEA